MEKWQSLLFCDEEKGAKFFDFDFFSQKRRDGEIENWISSLIHSQQHQQHQTKEKDDAGEKDNWGSFVIECSSSSFPVS